MKNQTIFKKEAIVSEFPFVSDVLDKLHKSLVDIDRIDIRRVDRSFLFSTPEDSAWDGSAGSEYAYQRLFYIAPRGEGRQVAEVPLSPHYLRGSNYAHSSREERNGDTYLSSIYGGYEDAAYFVLYFRQYSDWQGQEGADDVRTLTVLKPPKGFSVLDCIVEARREAAIEVVKAVDAVDCDPVTPYTLKAGERAIVRHRVGRKIGSGGHMARTLASIAIQREDGSLVYHGHTPYFIASTSTYASHYASGRNRADEAAYRLEVARLEAIAAQINKTAHERGGINV